MSCLLATLFVNPIVLERHHWMLLPLCLAVSLVYKTTKCPHPREIPLAVLVSWVTIVIGMYAVGIALQVIYYLVR